jgi:hypothetical protein
MAKSGRSSGQRQKGAHHWQRKANPMRSAKCERHFARAPEKILRHMLKRNGVEAARVWAGQKLATGILNRLLGVQ